MITWNYEQEEKFDEALDKMDFTGLDKEEIILNARCNAADVEGNDNQVDCAIATAEMYIDQGVSSF